MIRTAHAFESCHVGRSLKLPLLERLHPREQPLAAPSAVVRIVVLRCRIAQCLLHTPPLRRERGRARRSKEGQQSHLIAQITRQQDRKSTRLNSSHVAISYAVFC